MRFGQVSPLVDWDYGIPDVKRICLVPHLRGVGGMVSFQMKLAAGLSVRGFEVCYHLEDEPYQSVLVIGGTRQLAGLWKARRKGIPIIQRLNGMNWLHRKRQTGLRHYLRSEYGNILLAFIRSRLVDHIVYQSKFSQSWWERVYGADRTPWKVVYNGVDLGIYSPDGAHQRPSQSCRLLLVEGSLAGGYEAGLESAVLLGKKMSQDYHVPVELVIVGKTTAELRQYYLERASFPVFFSGLLAQQQIPEMDRSAHVLFAADLNAACPNSTIEALACGLPVVAFDTGALPELVMGDAGRVVPYGGNPWNLDPPDFDGLARAALDVWNDQSRFRQAARLRAEQCFGLDRMVEGYLDALDR